MREPLAHMTTADLEWYVTAGVSAAACPRLERIETHVAACADCAGRLVDEARLELTLIEVADRAKRPSRRVPVVAGALLAAAVLLLVVLGSAAARDYEPPAPEPAAAVTTPIDAGVRIALDSSMLGEPDDN